MPSFRAVFLASHKSLGVKFFSAVGSTVGFVRSRMLSSMKIERAFKTETASLDVLNELAYSSPNSHYEGIYSFPQST